MDLEAAIYCIAQCKFTVMNWLEMRDEVVAVVYDLSMERRICARCLYERVCVGVYIYGI